MIASFAVIVTTAIAFFFAKDIILALEAPAHLGKPLQIISPTEGFTTYILGVGLVAEMPVIIFALTRIGLVSRAWLAKRRGYILIICFVIGAVITPTPDPFNQTLVSVPMYLLFELGLLLSRIGGGRRAAS